MKLKALRLADVGPFTDAIALENLSGRLDVLIGPNEHGKSTLLRALRAVLIKKHNADPKSLDGLQPYAGGHPLVEADIEIGGRMLRIRKHFKGRTKGASAELIDLATGRTLANGEAAHDELATLFGARDGKEGPTGLLWLAQGDAIVPSPPDPQGTTTLREIIAREVETAASGDGARDLLTRVNERLAPLKVANALRPPKGTDFASAIEVRGGAVRQLADATAARDRTEAHKLVIAEKRQLLTTCSAPEHTAALAASVAAARSALDTGKAAADTLAKVSAECKTAELEHRNARAARERFEQQFAERQSIDVTIASSEAELTRRSVERETLHDQASATRALLGSRTGELAATRMAIEAALRAARADADRSELVKLEATASEATRQTAAIAQAEQAIAALGLTATTFADIERVDRTLVVLEAQCQSSSPTVHLDLIAGAERRVRVDNVPLAGNRDFAVDAPTVIEIVGIGRIAIAPGTDKDRADVVANRNSARIELAQLLARTSVSTVTDARAKDAARRKLDSMLGEHRARLAALAPNGISGIEVRIAELNARLRKSGQEAAPTETVEQLETGHALQEHAIADATKQAAELDRQLRVAELAEQQIANQLRNANERLAALTAALPADATMERQRITAAEQSAEARANALIREQRAFQDAAPSPGQLTALTAAHAKAVEAQSLNQRRSEEIARELAELEGRVAQAAGEGSGEAAAELAGEVARLDAEIARFERDRNALMLLAEALTASLAETRTAYLRPVLDRLGDLLPIVLPGADLDLDDDFSVSALARGDRKEQTDRLSGGTQEQIAILVRLAFARLLADGGQPTPLVLDDPLVYADDVRLDAMFAALALGAAAHQILVLSCHARAFTPLIERHGGHALELRKWNRS